MAKKRKLHFLITAGGTKEYIDPVRFITNASSGKMGTWLAVAAKAAGHSVTLISASDLQPPVGVEFVGVESAADMFAKVKKFFTDCDCLIMAAAVSDYTPIKPSKTKIKKSSSAVTLKLKPTRDILAWAGKNKNEGQCIVGFALEDKNLQKNAAKKFKQKNLDIIVANKLDSIGSDESSVRIKTKSGAWLKLTNEPKIAIAKQVIKLTEKLCSC